MIGFGLDYIPVEKRPNMDFADNGKDIFMPMVSLSLPIFNKKYKLKKSQLSKVKFLIFLCEMSTNKNIQIIEGDLNIAENAAHFL